MPQDLLSSHFTYKEKNPTIQAQYAQRTLNEIKKKLSMRSFRMKEGFAICLV